MEKFKTTLISISASLFIAIFAIIAANILYSKKESKKRGFEVFISKDGKPVVKQEKQVAIADLMKSANVENGAKIFKKCATCHNIESGSGNKIGPNLYKIVGKKKASNPSFSYSQAIASKGGSWTYDDLNLFLTKPKEFAPGTKMGFAGLKKPQDRADVIFYLEKK